MTNDKQKAIEKYIQNVEQFEQEYIDFIVNSIMRNPNVIKKNKVKIMNDIIDKNLDLANAILNILIEDTKITRKEQKIWDKKISSINSYFNKSTQLAA